MNTHSKADLLLAQRYVDDELTLGERSIFEERLHSDPELVQQVEALRDVRRAFVAERNLPSRVPPNFSARVLAAARQAPRESSDPADTMLAQRIARTGARVLLAASLIFGLALLIVSGVLKPPGSGRLEAAKDEIRKLVDQIRSKEGGELVLPR